MPNKYRVHLTKGMWKDPWPYWFDKFYQHCSKVAVEKEWHIDTVANYELKPHGKLIKTKTQGWYLRWNNEKYHALFVLKWS